jgi:hypothetical protein
VTRLLPRRQVAENTLSSASLCGRRRAGAPDGSRAFRRLRRASFEGSRLGRF